MRLLLSFVFSFWLLSESLAQKSSDLTMIINESTLNKLFTAIGPITGTNVYKVGFIGGVYNWTMKNARIELIKDSAKFITDVDVEAGPIKYSTPVPGKAAIKYDPKTNKINLTVIDAVFEIYTRILGRKVHIKDIQLAEYFTTPFVFDGPNNMETDMDFSMPDGSVKKIYTKTDNCKLHIQPHQIVLNSQLIFYEKVIKP
jgi:hypothetical protein